MLKRVPAHVFWAAAALAVALLAYGAIQARLLSGASLYLPQVVLVVTVAYLIGRGADVLVNSSARVAAALGASHLIIGLTVVAFGTSAPEMAASLVAGVQGNSDITIANVVGSNIFNLCFILGAVAALVPGGLQTERALVVRDGPLLFFGTVLLGALVGALPGAEPRPSTHDSLWPVVLNLRLERLEGLLLLAILVSYLYVLYRILRANTMRASQLPPDPHEEEDAFGKASWKDGPLFVLGLVLVVGGCHLLVGHVEDTDGAVHGFGALWFARMWDVPDYVVGVTIVAAGTSAPEFVVSLVAALRGAFGLSAGNLIGSDIFNMFGVVGLAGLVLQPPLAPTVQVSASATSSLFALCAVVAIVILFMRTGMRISRLEGIALVLIGIARWVVDFSTTA